MEEKRICVLPPVQQHADTAILRGGSLYSEKPVRPVRSGKATTPASTDPVNVLQGCPNGVTHGALKDHVFILAGLAREVAVEAIDRARREGKIAGQPTDPFLYYVPGHEPARVNLTRSSRDSSAPDSTEWLTVDDYWRSFWAPRPEWHIEVAGDGKPTAPAQPPEQISSSGHMDKPPGAHCNEKLRQCCLTTTYEGE